MKTKLKKPKMLALSKVKAPKMIKTAKAGKAPKMALLAAGPTLGGSSLRGGGQGRKRKRELF
jgi:hypothetical protein